jgi:DNA-binding response OmpR family regulator
MEKKLSILVVDDDREIGFMVKLMLEHKGFAVVVSERDEQLEKIIIENAVDIIILDMLIAGIKGTDTCARLKKNIPTLHIPVLMVTALPDAETICSLAGADDYLAKPFEMDELISKINSLAKKQPPLLHTLHN